ncbi:MAG: hypothetical protein K0U16_06975 [Gammaproteobacteria bacterium]|nr:hypothetical protein [Gammaproteobacteria bacterium]
MVHLECQHQESNNRLQERRHHQQILREFGATQMFRPSDWSNPPPIKTEEEEQHIWWVCASYDVPDRQQLSDDQQEFLWQLEKELATDGIGKAVEDIDTTIGYIWTRAHAVGFNSALWFECDITSISPPALRTMLQTELEPLWDELKAKDIHGVFVSTTDTRVKVWFVGEEQYPVCFVG